MKQVLYSGIVILFLFACSNKEEVENPSDYPQWVQDAVFYQIFPERFRNGDTNNDPDLQSLIGAYPHDIESDWQIHPWTSDWYQLQPWEEKNGMGFGFNAQRRRYGGDVQGIIDKLDYLADLGINAIYLNPVFESPSLHKYDAANYVHIDDNFGPNPALDRKIVATEIPDDPATWKWTTADSLFLKLLKKAHEKNIRIIIDGVFNHVGIKHWAFLDVKKNGQKSKYKDWFLVKSWDNPNTPEDEFKYAGWMNVAELPELKEDETGLVPPVKKHIFDILERWMDPNKDGDPSDGIDGWRLDVAEMVGHNFWKAFRTKVKSINHQAYITAELFWDDWQNELLMDPTPWLQGDQFDGTMNYRWSALVTNFFIDNKKKIFASSFLKKVEDLDKGYTDSTKYILLNLMDSHDTDRLTSNIVNPDLFYDKMISIYDNPYYDVRKPNENELEIYKLIVLFQFTYPGSPMIYYGSETGMWGADDPDERKPMIWDDLIYDDEVANISKTPRSRDKVYFDKQLYSYFKKIIYLRNNQAALRRGDFQKLLFDDKNDAFAFSRNYQDEDIIVIINNSDSKQNIIIPEIISEKWIDLLTKKSYNFDGLVLKVPLDGKSGKILKRK